jgi:hypothetical protein
MNNNLYNIDSKFRNKISFPNSANFIYNRMDQTVGTSTVIEPFNEKNVIEMRILSLELSNTIYYITSTRGNNKINIAGVDKTISSGSYTEYELATALSALVSNVTFTYNNSTGKMTISNTTGSSVTINFTASGTDYPSLGNIIGFTSNVTITTGNSSTGSNVVLELNQSYLFLRINDFGNIINRNHRYVGKIISENVKSVSNETTGGGININILSKQYKLISNVIKFDQPTNIQNLNISLEDEYGNTIDLNGGEWSFTLDTTVITNTILKNYNEIKFYNDEVMDRILKAKMLSYYDKQADQTTNSTLTSTYSSNITNLNNIQEYTPFGSTNNYSPSYSYFKNNDSRENQ